MLYIEAEVERPCRRCRSPPGVRRRLSSNEPPLVDVKRALTCHSFERTLSLEKLCPSFPASSVSFAMFYAAAALRDIFRDDGRLFLSLLVKTLCCHTQGDLETSCYVVTPCQIVYVKEEENKAECCFVFY